MLVHRALEFSATRDHPGADVSRHLPLVQYLRRVVGPSVVGTTKIYDDRRVSPTLQVMGRRSKINYGLANRLNMGRKFWQQLWRPGTCRDHHGIAFVLCMVIEGDDCMVKVDIPYHRLRMYFTALISQPDSQCANDTVCE